MPRIPRWLLLWASGVVSAAIVGGLGVIALVESGLYDASASAPHTRVIGWATHTTMRRFVQRGAKAITAPARFTPAQVEAGFQTYEARCVACHGGPGVARAAWTSALTPTPPYLLDAARQWTAPELYVIVHEGSKMTAMPAWGEFLSQGETWDVVAFLEALPELSPADYARMRETSPPKPSLALPR
jgi:mono/diheme cytochrome c family protein